MSEPKTEAPIVQVPIVQVPIVQVTVLEDRALITRRAQLDPSSQRVLIVEGVSPYLHDATLQAHAPGVRVDARVRRFLAKVDEVALAKPLAELEELNAALAEVEQVLADLKVVIQSSRQNLQLLTEELFSQTSLGRTSERASELFRAATAAYRGGLEERARYETKRQGIQESICGAQERYEGLSSAGSVERAQIELSLGALPSDQPLTLELTYLTPNAAWRPATRAALSRQSNGDTRDTVTLTALGYVWQRTGEDWRDVELKLSTERTSLGIEPPQLHEDWLRVQPAAPLTIDVREEEIEVASLGGEVRASAPVVPTVDDGGAPRHFTAAGRVSVESDGQAHVFEFDTYEAEARVDHLYLGALQPAVMTRVSFVHRGREPILAGPVELHRQHGPIGVTSSDFIATGERAEFAWGVSESIVARRAITRLPHKVSKIGSVRTQPIQIELQLTNLSDAPIADVVAMEGVPVSEVRQVKVELDPDKTTKGFELDEDGRLRWTLSLAPKEVRKLQLRYEVSAADGLHIEL